PPEAKLWCSVIATMIDFHRMSTEFGHDEGLNYGEPIIQGPFERLSTAEKYTVLEQVTKALIEPTPMPPKQTAVNESAIYYVFGWLRQEFYDVDGGEDVWGELVLDVLDSVREGGGDDEEWDEEDDYMPTMGCLDEYKWDSAIEGICDRILWDCDFEMEDIFPYGAANLELMAIMGIDSEYFRPYDGHVYPNAQQKLYTMVRMISG
ncbi:hypothetical protein HK104_001684, partial [Borealophlyctis nickersoniae]